MQNVPIKRKSKNKKAIKNSFKLTLTLFQLVNKHNGINKVVKRTKNKEIPSIPNVKFKFKLDNQKNFTTNWNELLDFWKKPHKNKELMKEKHEKFNAIIFNNFFLLEGMNNNNK